MVGRHHRLSRHKFEQALGVGEGQGSLACCSPWGRRKLDTTEPLNNKSRKLEESFFFLQQTVPHPLHLRAGR